MLAVRPHRLVRGHQLQLRPALAQHRVHLGTSRFDRRRGRAQLGTSIERGLLVVRWIEHRVRVGFDWRRCRGRRQRRRRGAMQQRVDLRCDDALLRSQLDPFVQHVSELRLGSKWILLRSQSRGVA
jgi:hypothetical protein